MAQNKPKILFIGESVTLAHVVRPLVLALSLDPKQYEVFFACDPRYRELVEKAGLSFFPIFSIPQEQFFETVKRGGQLFRYSDLERYVEEEKALLKTLQPDVVVGDFRLSLGVSAPACGVPYICITNAYWSAYALRDSWPVPSYRLTELLGESNAQRLFSLLQPILFRAIIRPVNRLRRKHGLKPFRDCLDGFTFGNHVVFADTPHLVPTNKLPSNHHYIGPITWSPTVEMPDWISNLSNDRPLIYVSLGSSGDVSLLPKVLEGLAKLPVYAAVTTAGRTKLEAPTPNIYLADFLPGTLVAKQAALTICNGGSPTSYQSLGVGTPVLGLASNLDQFLSMDNIVRSGAGELIRADGTDARQIELSVKTMLEKESYRHRAKFVAREFETYDCIVEFEKVLKQVAHQRASHSTHLKLG